MRNNISKKNWINGLLANFLRRPKDILILPIFLLSIFEIFAIVDWVGYSPIIAPNFFEILAYVATWFVAIYAVQNYLSFQK